MTTNKMFTLISYKMDIKGKVYECHNVHMTFESRIALDKLSQDSRMSQIRITGQFESLADAQAKQAELRKD